MMSVGTILAKMCDTIDGIRSAELSSGNQRGQQNAVIAAFGEMRIQSIGAMWYELQALNAQLPEDMRASIEEVSQSDNLDYLFRMLQEQQHEVELQEYGQGLLYNS